MLEFYYLQVKQTEVPWGKALVLEICEWSSVCSRHLGTCGTQPTLWACPHTDFVQLPKDPAQPLNLHRKGFSLLNLPFSNALAWLSPTVRGLGQLT